MSHCDIFKDESCLASKGLQMLPYLLLTCLFYAVSTNHSYAQETLAQRPTMHAFELQSMPVLDGEVLGDPSWQGVKPASDFWQVRPNEGQPATQKTEVYIGFIGDFLYIGMVAYDDNPEGIIVTDGRRDSGLNDSDSFRVIIDGLLDRQNGFVFGTNPVGMEYDAQVVKEGAGGGWDNSGFNLNPCLPDSSLMSAALIKPGRIKKKGQSGRKKLDRKTLSEKISRLKSISQSAPKVTAR